MSKFKQLLLGTQARTTIEISIGTHGAIPVDVRPITGAEELEALTQARAAAVEAALAPLATGAPAPAGDPARVARIAAENEAKHKAMVAKVTGKKAPAKGSKKAAAKVSRKPAAKPTRKAARRPSRG